MSDKAISLISTPLRFIPFIASLLTILCAAVLKRTNVRGIYCRKCNIILITASLLVDNQLKLRIVLFFVVSLHLHPPCFYSSPKWTNDTGPQKVIGFSIHAPLTRTLTHCFLKSSSQWQQCTLHVNIHSYIDGKDCIVLMDECCHVVVKRLDNRCTSTGPFHFFFFLRSCDERTTCFISQHGRPVDSEGLTWRPTYSHPPFCFCHPNNHGLWSYQAFLSL